MRYTTALYNLQPWSSNFILLMLQLLKYNCRFRHLLQKQTKQSRLAPLRPERWKAVINRPCQFLNGL